jgi:hypothetical protein
LRRVDPREIPILAADQGPESLMLERARQQTAIRQMEAVRVERVIVGNVLVELLSDPAFVALLRSQGFVTMPRRLRDNLEGRSP